MIRPVDFKFNTQTAGNNKFQQVSVQQDVQQQALREFDDFAALLRKNGVDVTVIDDTPDPETPDSIFPNNWISFHENGEVYLYPMYAENRRPERRQDILDILGRKFRIGRVTDLSGYEAQEQYLEGTGSMVLDRENKIAYACLSLRTSQEVLADFCNRSGYLPVAFSAADANGFPIYHTNVMMCIGSSFAVVCLDALPDTADRQKVASSIQASGKTLLPISLEQMNHFAGNMLEIKNNAGEHLLVMSAQALRSLRPEQVGQLELQGRIISPALYVIEQNGGGSARCMLAEIHLDER